ncbi:MAG: aminotransferase class V-fold PLP-dependent enzyme [Actinobacteria bacterium]|nr:aminotransferase class V-fold PLP-dependent enzyme [Actinomycetota bacterium]
MTFEEARAAFPVLGHQAYLNAGSMGPLARATHDAMAAQSERELAEGRSGPGFIEEMQNLRQAARERLAELLRVPAEHLSLTSSTTDGCNIVLSGLDLGPEDEIVTTDEEHFGLLGPLHVSGARVVVARTRDRPADESFDAILGCVTPRTRLLALSHISWLTGKLPPIRELKDETALPVLVDGAQSVGAIEVDARPFDFYTVSAQKWLCGPDGTGGLCVLDPERLRVAMPSYFAQAAYEVDGSFTAKPGAARFDPGWLPPASLAGLLAAIDAAPAWRFERAAEIAERCRKRLSERYAVVTEPGQGTLVTFSPGKEDLDALVARMYDDGVVVRRLPGTGWLRVSCGYWTSDEDLERLLAALEAE